MVCYHYCCQHPIIAQTRTTLTFCVESDSLNKYEFSWGFSKTFGVSIRINSISNKNSHWRTRWLKKAFRSNCQLKHFHTTAKLMIHIPSRKLLVNSKYSNKRALRERTDRIGTKLSRSRRVNKKSIIDLMIIPCSKSALWIHYIRWLRTLCATIGTAMVTLP